MDLCHTCNGNGSRKQASTLHIRDTPWDQGQLSWPQHPTNASDDGSDKDDNEEDDDDDDSDNYDDEADSAATNTTEDINGTGEDEDEESDDDDSDDDFIQRVFLLQTDRHPLLSTCLPSPAHQLPTTMQPPRSLHNIDFKHHTIALRPHSENVISRSCLDGHGHR